MRAFCDAHGLYLFEDNCESMGASLNGKPCGTFGDVNTFSTFYSHHISTMEGGLLVTNDTEIASSGARDSQSRLGARPAGRLDRLDAPARRSISSRPTGSSCPATTSVRWRCAGAVGLEQLKKLDAMIAIRRANAALFVRLFEGDERFIIQRENGRSSWFSFTLILNPALALDRATGHGGAAGGGHRLPHDYRRLLSPATRPSSTSTTTSSATS